MVGKQIGPYKILSKLGSGGMATVYRAFDISLERSVALKLLHRGATAAGAARFREEAKAAARFPVHPNIVAIYQVLDTDFGPCIVMEHVDGYTLRQRIQDLSITDSIRIVKEVAAALALAHSVDMVHRDIKPENVILTTGGTAKVLDFGLAKTLVAKNARGTKTPRTETGPHTIMGTPRYMSPEQTRGEKLTTRTDIFSLGIVFYELLTKRHPFEGAGEWIIEAIRSFHPTPPSQVQGMQNAISPQLDALVLSMLHKIPSERPEAGEIESVLTSLPTNKRARTSETVKPHCVGRDKELADLENAFERATLERGLLCCVRGELGIGKTTLVEDFVSRHESAWIARGQCSERLAGTQGFLPLLDALDGLRKRQSGELVESMLKSQAPNWYFQVVPPASQDSTIRRPAVPRENLLQQMNRELRFFLGKLSRSKPVIVFFDDVHWADASTIDVLGYLSNHFDELRILIVVTYRPSDLAEQHATSKLISELTVKDRCSEISLSFLTAAEIEQYLALEFPNHNFPREFVHLIDERTEGNPLFMSNLLRELRNREVIKREANTWVLTEAVESLEQELPQNVRNLVEQKLRQFSREDHDLLLVAAVQGSEFDPTVVARALGRDPLAVEQRMEMLESTGLVTPIGEHDLPVGGLSQRYGFVHVLYQNVLYSSLLPKRRQRLSADVARALLESYNGDGRPVASALSLLFESSQDFDEASKYSYMAAENAASISAHKEAVLLARRGLEQLKKVAATERPDARELAFLIILGGALMATRGIGASEIEAVYARAQQLAESIGTSQQRLAVLRGLWGYNIVRGNFGVAQQLSNDLLRLAKKSSNHPLRIEAHHALGFTSGHRAKFTKAIRHHTLGIALFDRQPRRDYAFLFALDPSVGCKVEMGTNLWILGYPDDAIDIAEKGRQEAEKFANIYTQGFALMYTAGIYEMRGEPHHTERLTSKAREIAEEHGFPELLGWSTVRIGWALAAQQRQQQGISMMKAGLNDLRNIGSRVAWPHFLGLLAECLLQVEIIDEALAVAEQGLAATHSTGAQYYEAELLRLRSDCFVAMGESHFARAERGYLDSLEVAHAQKALSWELRTSMSFLNLLTKQKRETEGKSRLGEVYSRFSQGFNTQDLMNARRLLEEVVSSEF
jgi:serine/threonine protein kinase/predicted ATPase